MEIIDINQFIKNKITGRKESLFHSDIEKNSEKLWREIKGKKVIVIGGAGTIGSSFIRAILKFEPNKLVVVDTNENGLTELTRDLRSGAEHKVPKEYVTYPMNFGDTVFKKMYLREGPFDIVANFAAHKHVRSEKDEYSIEAMIDNNVFKAENFLEFLIPHPPEHFFCVSTDKAANPVNVMGASKKLMEETIMAYSKILKITTARFANVAFSNGSLLDGYIFRLLKKQAISCPSDIKRFFVSPEESGQICMLACILGQSGDIFFPNLEESDLMLFKTITENFFQEMGIEIEECHSDEEAISKSNGLDLNSKYPVYFFETNTSGEKLYEEFYTDTDIVDSHSFDSLGVIKNALRPELSVIKNIIKEFKTLFSEGEYDKAKIIDLLNETLPGFKHIETGKNLDQKM